MSGNDIDSHEDRAEQQSTAPGNQYHGWKLLAGIMLVVTFLAITSAVIDWMVIGPLEGRML